MVGLAMTFPRSSLGAQRSDPLFERRFASAKTLAMTDLYNIETNRNGVSAERKTPEERKMLCRKMVKWQRRRSPIDKLRSEVV